MLFEGNTKLLHVYRIFAKVDLGNTFEDIKFGLQEGNIFDYVTTDEEGNPTYVFENVSKGITNAIEISLYHNSKDEVPIRLSAVTNAEFYINLSLPVIKEVELFFTSHLKSNKIDISYYAELAKIQFLQYLNRGIDNVVSIEE